MKKDKTTEEEVLKDIQKNLKILEERTKEGLIGEEIAIGLFGEKKAKELLSSITKH